MNSEIHFPNCFVKKPKNSNIDIFVMSNESFRLSNSSLTDAEKAICDDLGFNGSSKQIAPVFGDKGLEKVLVGIGNKASIQHGAKISRYLQEQISQTKLKNTSFTFMEDDIPQEALGRLSLGWGLASIRSDKRFKNNELPKLVVPESIDWKEVVGLTEGVYITRTLINTPANELGPEELVMAASQIAELSGGKMETIRDKDLLKQNFPMIYAVGNSSHRRPALIDIRWKKKNAPKVTLVGKGIVFDTGGLDIKPSQAMRLMKKDMGGAAQVLGLAWALIKTGANIDLRVLIPVAENAVSSEAFRPGDVIKTRKGLEVEVTDTDAEGRLVLADALTYACEDKDKPELLLDFATLTGAARVALGTRIGALFGANTATTQKLQNHSVTHEDPLWTLPLWEDYRAEMHSNFADIDNIGSGKAGAIYGGLFLKSFVDDDIDWAHMDVYAWEDSGRDAFDQGGMDQGLRAVYALLKQRYQI